jgi:endonuclease-3
MFFYRAEYGIIISGGYMGNNDEILKRLERHYPEARPGLYFDTPFQLLIATILSAQTTDRQVNAVTEGLFYTHSDAKSMLKLNRDELEKIIKSCGFYKTKANNVLETCRILVEKYGGEVPQTMEELTALPGVGRKTANVVLSNAFQVPAIAVDTHVFRVTNRLGLAEAKDVFETEKQLMRNIPKDKWSQAHHWLIWHGRRICFARKPDCNGCFLNDVCKYAKER